MGSRRTVILVVAIAVGALAAFLILRYVGNVEDRANADGELVQVLTVTGDIARGEKSDDALAAGKLAMGKRRRIDLPANAVVRPEDVKGLVAAIGLAPGEIVTTPKFVDEANLTNSKSAALEDGMVAVTVSVDTTRGVAGLIQPGDFVNVMVRMDGGGGDAASSEIRVGNLFQKVKVLAIGRDLGTPVAAAPAGAVAPATTAPAASDLVTLEVPPESAAIISAATERSIRLALVRPDYSPRPLLPGVLNGGSALPGDVGLTPYQGQPAGTTVGNGR